MATLDAKTSFLKRKAKQLIALSWVIVSVQPCVAQDLEQWKENDYSLKKALQQGYKVVSVTDTQRQDNSGHVFITTVTYLIKDVDMMQCTYSSIYGQEGKSVGTHIKCYSLVDPYEKGTGKRISYPEVYREEGLGLSVGGLCAAAQQ
jgi:hypothetical protein